MCEECGEDVCKYFGESGRNGFTRGGEHLSNREAEDENKSILKLHSNHHHNGRPVNFIILMNRRNEMGGVRVDRVQYRRGGGD